MPSSWQPVLTGESAARATAAVDAVAAAIGEAPLPRQAALGAPLSAGDAGVALLFEYLDRARPGMGYQELAQLRLDRAIDALAAVDMTPGLFSGFTGAAWVTEHLLRGAALPVGEEDPNEDIDAALLRHLRQTPWDRAYDLTDGLVGFGVYALERLPRAAAVSCLELVVDRLG